MNARRTAYPTTALIKRMVEAVRAAGVDVAGVEVSPDGTVRMLPAKALAGPTVFDRWEGQL